MKRTMLVLAALVAMVATGCGGTRGARRDVATVTPDVADRQEGVVATVDEEWIAVTAADRPAEPPVRFRIDETTEVRRGDETIDADAITEGEVVRVSYEPRAGDEQARRIEILDGDEAAQVRARAVAPPAWPRPERPSGTMEPTEPMDSE